MSQFDFKCFKSEKSGNIVLGPVRLVFPHLDEPQVNDDGQEVWDGVLLIPAGSDIQPLKDAIATVVKEKFGDKPPKFTHGSPLKPQDGWTNKDDEPYDFIEEGGLRVNVKTYRKPVIVDRNREPIADVKEELYGGCYVMAAINPRDYNKKGNRGVSVYLQQLQKVAEGDRIGGGGRAKPEDDFDALPVAATASAEDLF